MNGYQWFALMVLVTVAWCINHTLNRLIKAVEDEGRTTRMTIGLIR